MEMSTSVENTTVYSGLPSRRKITRTKLMKDMITTATNGSLTTIGSRDIHVVPPHTVNPNMTWMTMIILMVNSFGIYYSEGSDSRHKISKSITLHQSQESSIKSPGYPTKHYEKDTVYIWTVTAPGTTEEITINILDLDIQYTPGIPCDDYLKIQDTDDENFAISKQCEKPWRKTVVAKGNKLKITLFSNYDRLTGKGFNLILRVTKTKLTTTQTTTKGIPTTTPVPMTSPTSVQTTTRRLVTKTKRTTPRPTPNDIPTTTPVLVTSSTSVQTTSNHLGISCEGDTFFNHRMLQELDETCIQSPGYPNHNYPKDTTYIWIITAPETTDEITITILNLDIHYTLGYTCEDYLKIQDTEDEKVSLFKQCRRSRDNTIITRGNKLNITLFSNSDNLTGKGFKLSLRVTKVKRTSTRPSISGILSENSAVMEISTSVYSGKLLNSCLGE
ncbi:uncharacterized protein LOC125647622 [Ostrea edulis]|uniref:uncharacterized protein LOC125647622 n=1 Tax=Ostrea edulis TaxID=37623 RepID=UPI0024AF7EB7|nr:uncharacterized protein LOC125647622 [Ostrea edulis]